MQARTLIGELFAAWQRESQGAAKPNRQEIRAYFREGVPVIEQRRIKAEAEAELDRQRAELKDALAEVEELRARCKALETA